MNVPMCLSVCLCFFSVCKHIPELKTLPKIQCMLSVAVAQSSSGGLATLCISSFVDNVLFLHESVLSKEVIYSMLEGA